MKTQNRQGLLLVLAAIALAVLAGDYLLLSPLQNAWKSRANRIAELENRVRAGEGLLNREQAIRGRWEYMTTNTLPSDLSSAEQTMLQAFDGWSRDSRLNLTSLNPQWRSDSEDYMTLQCRVEASGDLNTIVNFLHSVEQDPLAIRIDSLELTASDATGGQIGLTLQASGLVLLPANTQEGYR